MFRSIYSNDWFTVSSILLIVLLLVLKQINSGKFSKFSSFNYIDFYWLSNHKQRKLISNFEIFIFLISHIVLAQIIVMLMERKIDFFFVQDKTLLLFAIIFIITALFSVLKLNLERFINYSINGHKLLDFYIYYKQFICTYGLFMVFPILILRTFYPAIDIAVVYTIAGVIGLFVVYNFINFIYKFRKQIIPNWYYIILYLCTLEIAPYFFIYKLFSNK